MSEYKTVAQLSPKEIDAWRAARWKARTDLGWLCRNVLGYHDVSDNTYQPGGITDSGPKLPIHQPLIDTVQHFPVPTKQQMVEHDQFINGKWHYKPLVPMTRLPGHRRTLILDARGFLKTTINTMAHKIQWLVNYPDIAIMVVQSNGAKAEVFISEIKEHFMINPKFRQLFPEHVPQKNVFDFGTRGQFTTLARSPGMIRREPSVMASSIDKGMAGYHVDVIACSDIVDPSNINGQGLQDTYRSFKYLEPLLVSPNHWIDVEGTRYHSDDCYGRIIENDLRRPVHERQFKMYVRSCFQRVTPNGDPPKFTPEELKYPFKLDEKGKPMSWWPERFTTLYYEQMKEDDPFVFATQQLNDPSAVGGRKPFPVCSRVPGTGEQIPMDVKGQKKRYPVYISRQNFTQNVPVSHRELVIDTAETAGKRSDYTVITVVAWDRGYGRAYVDEIWRGRYLPDELINTIVKLCLKHKPLKVKIEETGFVRGIMSSLRREIEKASWKYNNLHVTVDPIKRDNQMAKTERILHSLQPWYVNDEIRFLDDLDDFCPGVIDALELELDTFPAGKNDDILDTLADVFQNKKFFGKENNRATHVDLAHMQQQALRRMLTGVPPEWNQIDTEVSGEGYYL